MRTRVAIIGGGLAGLLTAAELLRCGVEDVVVIERSPGLGGVARTIRRDGYTLEPAVGTLTLPHPTLSPIIEHLGVETAPAVGTGARYVFTGERMVEIVQSPAMLNAPVLPLPSRLRALGEVLAPRGDGSDESLGSFMRRRFGTGAGNLLAWLAASGVFAGDPERTSATAAFPMLTGLEQQAGSLTRGMIERRRGRPAGAEQPAPAVPRGGIRAIADAAATVLGDRARVDTEATSLLRRGSQWLVEAGEAITCDHVVFACGHEATARLVGLDAPLLEASPPPRAPVVVVGLGGSSPGMAIPDGFGVLTAPGLGMATLGVLLESSYAPDRAPAGHALVKVIAGGATRPDVVGWDDDVLVERIGGEAARILGRVLDASFVEVVRHPGIPQYHVGHAAWLEQVDRSLDPGLHVTGWEYRGVGVAHLASDAKRVVAAIEEPR